MVVVAGIRVLPLTLGFLVVHYVDVPARLRNFLREVVQLRGHVLRAHRSAVLVRPRVEIGWLTHAHQLAEQHAVPLGLVVVLLLGWDLLGVVVDLVHSQRSGLVAHVHFAQSKLVVDAVYQLDWRVLVQLAVCLVLSSQLLGLLVDAVNLLLAHLLTWQFHLPKIAGVSQVCSIGYLSMLALNIVRHLLLINYFWVLVVDVDEVL